MADDPDADRPRAIEGRGLATGGAALGLATMVANAGNYLLNVFLGRWLTPAEFADANLMVTVMLLVTAGAISLQLLAARFSGINMANEDPDATAALGRWLTRRAVTAGGFVAAVLVLGTGLWRDFFNSESAWPFVILGLGMPFYLAQAVGRGLLQGRLAFLPLAATFVVEMLVRVIAGIGLVALGFGVEGATVALTLSFLAVWLHVRVLVGPGRFVPMSSEAIGRLVAYASPVALLLLGQIIINNGDVLIAKRFLEPDTAGTYAAVALAGRAVFFLSWSVATTLFPAATQRNERGMESNSLLHGGLVVVAVMGICSVVGAFLFGGALLGGVFGAAYADLSSQLARYALATTLFAMANLVVSHHLSIGRVRPALVLLGGGVAQTVLLLIGRSSIDSLITAQLVAMALLLAAVGASHVLIIRNGRSTADRSALSATYESSPS